MNRTTCKKDSAIALPMARVSGRGTVQRRSDFGGRHGRNWPYASSADRMCAQEGAHYSRVPRRVRVNFVSFSSGTGANVPPFAQLAAELAVIEGQDEDAVELDAHAARSRFQLGRPACDSGLAVDGDDARREVDVALVRRHGGPIIANAAASGFRYVERHLVIRRVLCEQRGGARGVALLPRLFVAGEPSLEGGRGQLASGHGDHLLQRGQIYFRPFILENRSVPFYLSPVEGRDGRASFMV